MIETSKALKYLEYFSVITVSENKVPNFPWKSAQSQKIDRQTFIKNYEYSGGIIKKDGSEIPKTDNFGIVTGFDFLECLDIDLKVLSTAQEQRLFWNEFLQNLEDNILDFKDKFVIYKTKNSGYHILYKTKRVEGNLKIAKLKGHKECIIETRGIGGYVFVYPENKISKKSYFDIDFISDEDREILMFFSKMYNFIDDKPIELKKEKTEFVTGELSPWQDYNNKTNIWDIISEDFIIPQNGNKSKHIIVKRNGSLSTHSGYIFKDSGCLFLFSTGTIYPNEKLITPFIAYSYKNFNGDFSESAKELYKIGFGSRIKKKIQELKQHINLAEETKIIKEDLVFPIDIFHPDIQSYLLECNSKLDSSIEYMGVSLLWVISVCVGNAIEMEVKKGWIENLSVWISVVGKAGIGKTPSISNILAPINKINAKEIKTFIKESEKYDIYNALTKKEKDENVEVPKPIKKQFIANDITLEALVDLHQESDNAVGVFKDELAGWLKDMNKYREGSDLEFWLSTWSGKSVNLNRLTRRGSFVEKPFIPVLGGIQPAIFNSFYTDENKDNGFMDRMLLCYPDLIVEKYNDNEIDEDSLIWYKELIIMFYDTIKSSIKRDEDGTIISKIAKFSAEAKIEWMRIFNEITDIQNSDEENEYLKSMYPKQKSYIPRFACLLHVFNQFMYSNGNALLISKESVLNAEKLSKYFVATAKKIKINSIETSKLKNVISNSKNKNEKEKLFEIIKENPKFNKSETANLLGISRVTLNSWILEEKERKV